jgi:hypothetical protein
MFEKVVQKSQKARGLAQIVRKRKGEIESIA